MNNKITFPRLATMLADRSGRSKRFSEDFLREFFALISETLESQESVKIKGFGTFRLSRVEPRRSVDVTTGEPMEISGHTKVVFTPSKELADAVNAPFEAFSAIEISDDANIEQLFTPEEIQLQSEDDDNSNNHDFEVGNSNKPYPASSDDTEESVISFGKEAQDPEFDDEYDIQVIGGGFNTPIERDEGKNLPVEHVDSLEEENEEEYAVEPEASDKKIVSNEIVETGTTGYTEELSNLEKQEDSEILPVVAEENNIEEDRTDPTEEETGTEDVNDSSEISEEVEEFEEENSRREKWVKGLFIVFGAAIVALIATVAIWYVFSGNDFNYFFKKTDTVASDRTTSGLAVNKNALSPNTSVTDPDVFVDSSSDSIQESEIEEDVPTAPSDVVVYDTIGTTRYLTTMAKSHYGNYNLWPYIYQENQSFLGHPDRIRPGTPVVIPKLSKYGVDPNNAADVEKAKKLGVEIYARYGKKI